MGGGESSCQRLLGQYNLFGIIGFQLGRATFKGLQQTRQSQRPEGFIVKLLVVFNADGKGHVERKKRKNQHAQDKNVFAEFAPSRTHLLLHAHEAVVDFCENKNKEKDN